MTWDAFKHSDHGMHIGSEHAVEFVRELERVGKWTIPPAFGLIPRVVSHPVVNLRDDPSLPAFRRAVEFLPATAHEKLEAFLGLYPG